MDGKVFEQVTHLRNHRDELVEPEPAQSRNVFTADLTYFNETPPLKKKVLLPLCGFTLITKGS